MEQRLEDAEDDRGRRAPPDPAADTGAGVCFNANASDLLSADWVTVSGSFDNLYICSNV